VGLGTGRRSRARQRRLPGSAFQPGSLAGGSSLTRTS
jgi:hypothetical protein